MATVTFFLDNVTAFAEGRSDLRGNAEIFSVDPHSIPSKGVTALLKLRQFLLVALPAFFRKNHGFGLKRRFMIRVAGDAVHPFLCMLRFDPGLEETGGSLLMAGDAESDIDLLVFILLNRHTRNEG